MVELVPKEQPNLEAEVKRLSLKAVLFLSPDCSVARFYHKAPAIRDGEQHWVGGTVDYQQNEEDCARDTDYEYPEDSRYQLVQHQQNQQY